MRAVSFVSACLCGFLLSGCNAMQGLGTDITHLGQSLHGAASRAKMQPAPQRTQNPGNARMQPNYPVQPLEARELETMPYEKYDEARPSRMKD